MDINKVIIRPDGQDSVISYPSKKLINSLKNEKGEVDVDKLPPDTVRNVILQSLNFYVSKAGDVEDGAMVMYISQEVIKSEGELHLKEKFMNFLVKVLKEQISREEKGNKKPDGIFETVQKGSYKAWCIYQVLEELGIKTDIS